MSIKVVVIAATAGLSYYFGQKTTSNNVAISETDNNFIRDLEKNLKSRSDLSNKTIKTAQKNPSEYDEQEYINSLIDCEKSILEYKDASFDNPRLKKLSEDYIAGLEKQINSVTYYNADYSKYYDEWQDGASERSVAIVALIDEFNLKVSDESITEFRNNAKATNEKNDQEKAVKALLDSIVFSASETVGGYTTYTAVVENTTSYNFDYLNLNINLISNDVIKETVYDSVNNWKIGDKVEFEFTTDKSFDKYTADGDYSLK